MPFLHPRKFFAYDPFLSFNDRTSFTFKRSDKSALGDLTQDTYALFCVGRQAFRRLPQLDSELEFNAAALKSYAIGVEGLRTVLADLNSDGVIKPITLSGIDVCPDWAEADDTQILNSAWQVFSSIKGSRDDLTSAAMRELFLVHALLEIDNALVGLTLGGLGAVAAAVEAGNALANAVAIESGSATLQQARKEIAFSGAMGMLARDPRQKEKSFVFECWKDWQRTPGRYKGKAAFARDMLSKCKHLTSQKKIEDWCREWEKAHPAG